MIKKIFKITSMVIILALVAFYGYRLIHYYKIYNPKTITNNKLEKVYLHKKIINNSYTDGSLIQNGTEYIYDGTATNNYLKYSGMLWQIISINENREIKMILKDNLKVMANNETFDNSYIKEYLNNENNYLYKELESPDAYLVDTTVCLDNITDMEELTCNQKGKYKIGIASLNDYALTGGINGFLNNNTNFWLSNYNDDSYYYVSKDNEIEMTKISHIYGIRPVVTLNSKILYTGGEGTISNPYILSEGRINILNQKFINSYVYFADKTWKIIEQAATGTKIVLNDALETKMIYDKKIINYEESAIYKYLNEDFYNSISNKEKIIKGSWYTGYYNALNNYDYKSIYEKKVDAYVGLLNINDFFVSEYHSIYTLTPLSETSRAVYTITEDGLVYSDDIYRERYIRPVIYLDSNMEIKSGSGLLDDPYILED